MKICNALFIFGSVVSHVDVLRPKHLEVMDCVCPEKVRVCQGVVCFTRFKKNTKTAHGLMVRLARQ